MSVSWFFVFSLDVKKNELEQSDFFRWFVKHEEKVQLSGRMFFSDGTLL